MTKQVSPFITVDELSRLLKVPKGTIYFWVSQKDIPHMRFGKHIRFEYLKVLKFFNQGL